MANRPNPTEIVKESFCLEFFHLFSNFRLEVLSYDIIFIFNDNTSVYFNPLVIGKGNLFPDDSLSTIGNKETFFRIFLMLLVVVSGEQMIVHHCYINHLSKKG